VSGIEVARAWSGSCAERVNLSPRARGRPVALDGPAVVRGSEIPKRLKP
jgi:hypothetical protein